MTRFGSPAAAAVLAVFAAAAVSGESAAAEGVARASAGDRGMALMSAAVGADGVLAVAEGATGASFDGTNRYDVSFGRDVTACTSVGSTKDTNAPYGSGPLPGRTVVAITPTLPQTVTVRTFDVQGAAAARAFQIIVYCGR